MGDSQRKKPIDWEVGPIQDGRLAAILNAKFHFMTYLAGNFCNHISYEFYILEECVALLPYKHTKKLGHPIKNGRLAAIFVFEKWNFLEKIIISPFLFIIYIHNELHYCSKMYRGTSFQ